ncbi:DUF1343 domain-containing protein [Eubacteriales bacterium mix99]
MTAGVLTGIDRTEECRRVFGNARLGLITGYSGLARNMKTSIDVLKERFNLRVLFSPEHGVRGILGPGEKVSFYIDRFSGLPAYSLYEDSISSGDGGAKDRVYQPSREAMNQIDMMVFDIQDVGSRYYTYASTLFHAMRACTAADKKMVVLDRPNPIGGTVLEGNCHTKDLLSFIGLTQIPIRHSWTMGEMAQYYNGEHHLGCDLGVIPVQGWNREMYFNETGLPFVKPSPNLPTPDSILVYNGTCLFSGTNVSEGRGTTTPFTTIGAPYIDPIALSDRMNREHCPGLAFSPAFFIPSFGKHAGKCCYGVQIHISEPKAVRAVELGVLLMCTIREMYPGQFAFNPPPSEGAHYHIDLASGNTDLREGKLSADQILSKWNKEAAAFRPIHQKYRIYD